MSLQLQLLQRSPSLLGAGCLLRRLKFLGLHDALAFLDVDQLIDLHVFHGVDLSAGPAHFEEVDFRGLAEAEVNAQVALRNVASSAADLIDLLVRLCFVRVRW